FSLHWLRNQIENFHAAVQLVRQVVQIRRYHRQERIGPGGHDVFLLVAPVGTVMTSLLHFPRRLPVTGRRAGPQSFRESQESRAEKRRVLKKSSSRAAHACLPNGDSNCVSG